MHLKQMYRLTIFSPCHIEKMFSQNIFVFWGAFLFLISLSACSPFSQNKSNHKPEATVVFSNTQQEAQAITPNGLPALRPLKGIKTEMLFSQNIRDTNQRLDRVENVVLNLAKEFEAIKPAIIRLVAIESDMQQLMGFLDVKLEDTTITSPAPTETRPRNILPPVPSPPKNTIKTAPPPQKNKTDSTFVKNIRIGQHNKFTRIVLDISNKTPHSVELDNQENIILIELPNSKWGADLNKKFHKLPMIESYGATPMNNGAGSRILIALKKNIKITNDKVIPATKNNDFRVFIDISAQN